MTSFESKRPSVFAKIQSDLRAKICVWKIDVHVFAMSHSCHRSTKHEFLAKQGVQRADVNLLYQISGCRLKHDNSNMFWNLTIAISKNQILRALLFEKMGFSNFSCGWTFQASHKKFVKFCTPPPPPFKFCSCGQIWWRFAEKNLWRVVKIVRNIFYSQQHCKGGWGDFYDFHMRSGKFLEANLRFCDMAIFMKKCVCNFATWRFSWKTLCLQFCVIFCPLSILKQHAIFHCINCLRHMIDAQMCRVVWSISGVHNDCWLMHQFWESS